MDPDTALENLRTLVAAANEQGEHFEQVEELVEQVEALDKWLSNGGFYPLDWADGIA